MSCQSVICHLVSASGAQRKTIGTIRATMGAESRESRRGDDYFARVARS